MTDEQRQTLIATALRQAQQLASAQRLPEAMQVIEAALAKEPENPELLRLAGHLQLATGNSQQGLSKLKEAVEASGGRPELLIEYGHRLVQSGDRIGALGVADQAAQSKLSDHRLLDSLGTLFTYCEESQFALPHFEAAVNADPNNAGYRYNLATAQRMNGALDEAEANLDCVISVRANDYVAYMTRADLRKQTEDRNHVEEIQKVIESVRDDTTATALFFALSKELDDLGRYDEAIDALKRGCAAHRSTYHYDVEADIAVIDRLIKTHNKTTLFGNGVKGCEENAPIFILGLPRSGTTLVERIVSAHSKVEARGELNAFPQAIITAVQSLTSERIDKTQFAELSLQANAFQVGRAYIDAVRPGGDAETAPHFTDKLPLNYLYAGLIARALPNARFIALSRDAMDSCHGMLKVLFTSAYPFSYDLREVGRYYAAWQRLMAHWQNAIGDRWLSVRYEDLVANQENETRRIINHLGLEWEEACLSFHTQQSAVSTASAVQVRQPLYKDAVGRWKRYGDALAPLREELKKQGVDVD
jgi:tetratricopeptide (TPR) repeat protein